MYRNQSQYSSVRLDHEAIHNLEAEPLVGITERKIGLALIDPRRLMRCCISGLLSRYAPEFFVMPYVSCRKLANSLDIKKRYIRILILNMDGASISEPKVQSDINLLRDAFPDTPLVLLSDHTDLDCSIDSLCEKVNGYITTNMAPTVAIAAIRLVYAGGQYIPTETLSSYSCSIQPTASMSSKSTSKSKVEGLTSRQYEVFKQLKKGKSNKLIAYELGVQESTIKVHVREIMKKLHATNRTHAVFLASKTSELERPNQH
jgi:DNA-binding NarL/FixJ family response regulator